MATFFFFRGTPAAETVSGTEDGDRFLGDGGDDSLIGRGGADTIDGEADDDILLGEGGDDRLDGGAGSDTLLGGEGDDRILWNGRGLADGGAGADTLELGAGATLAGSGAFLCIEMLVPDGTLAGSAGADLFDLFDLAVSGSLLRIGGGDGADTLIGGAFRLDAAGGAGDDLLAGRGRADTLAGGEGDDTLRGGEGDDSLSGGAGNDVLVVEGAADTLDGGDGDDLLWVGDRAEGQSVIGTEIRVFGGAGADTLVGGGGPAPAFAAGEGGIVAFAVQEYFDLLAGGAGNDRYVVHRAGERIEERAGEGIDLLLGSVSCTLPAEVERLRLVGGATEGTGHAGDNRIDGNAMDNRLRGLEGRDVLVGAEGADTLIGGEGRDLLLGGAGADRFVIDAPAEGPDRIMDFVSGEDAILLAMAGFAGLQAGSFVARGSNAATAPAGTAQLIYHTGLGWLSFDPDGLGGAQALRLAVLTGAPVLAASDILLG